MNRRVFFSFNILILVYFMGVICYHREISINKKLVHFRAYSTGISDHDNFERTIDKIRKDRDQKRKELITLESVLEKAERELAVSNFNSSLANITRNSGYDYGFISKSVGPQVSTISTSGDAVPASAIVLAIQNFKLELSNLVLSFKRNVSEPIDPILQKLSSLKLSNEAIWERENSRSEIRAPWVIKAPYLLLCLFLDVLFDGNPIERFYFLETVARMPYFSYITMLHAYETLGWWRRSSDAKRVHFAEELNEFNHLLIMISLGGDQRWRVRFFAQHAAIAYYFVLIIVWLLSPSLAYNFSELIEAHAVDTYAEFAESNKDILLTLEAPTTAKEYYEAYDLYVFDEFQTSRAKGSRRPIVNNLYDVFCNICDDESEHVKTMGACQDRRVVLKSPNTEAAIITGLIASAVVAYLVSNPSAEPINSEFIDTFVENISNTARSGATAIGVSGDSVAEVMSDIENEVTSAVDESSSMIELSSGFLFSDILRKGLVFFEKYIKFFL